MKDILENTSYTNDEAFEFAEATRAWRPFIEWLKTNEDEESVLKCLAYEIENECRPSILDRLRTRFNALRAKRELVELESTTKKIISLNYRK